MAAAGTPRGAPGPLPRSGRGWRRAPGWQACACGPADGEPSPGEAEEEVENPEVVDLPEKLRHQLRHRELFLSRQLESLPATHIRYLAGSRARGLPALVP